MAGSIFYRKWVIRKTLRKLYALRQQDDETSYMNALKAMDVTLYFPKFTRNLLILNYYVDKKEKEKAYLAYEEIKLVKTNRENRIAMNMKMYGFFLENKEQEQASICLEELLRLLKQSKAKNAKSLLREVEQLDAVYLQKNIEWIPILLDGVKQVKDPEYQSILLFRLAKLYYYAKDEENCKQAIIEACEHTRQEANKKRLQYVLHHLEDLA